jgi:hypothetical protein
MKAPINGVEPILKNTIFSEGFKDLATSQNILYIYIYYFFEE